MAQTIGDFLHQFTQQLTGPTVQPTGERAPRGARAPRAVQPAQVSPQDAAWAQAQADAARIVPDAPFTEGFQLSSLLQSLIPQGPAGVAAAVAPQGTPGWAGGGQQVSGEAGYVPDTVFNPATGGGRQVGVEAPLTAGPTGGGGRQVSGAEVAARGGGKVKASGPKQSITPVQVDQKNWFEKQANAPWLGQAGGVAKSVGNGAKEGGGLLGKIGGGLMDLVGPDMQAWKDIASGDATLSDWGNAALDASILIPGVGIAGRTAGKAALKATARGAGKAAGKTAAKRGTFSKLMFDDASLGKSIATAQKAAKGGKSAAKAKPQRGVNQKLEGLQQKMAPQNLSKNQNALLGRNKGKIHPLSTSKTAMGTKLALAGQRNIRSGQAFGNRTGGDSGPEDMFSVDFGDGAVEMPGSAQIGYVVGGGGGGGGGAVQPMSVAEAAAQMAAGSLQSGGSWVRLS